MLACSCGLLDVRLPVVEAADSDLKLSSIRFSIYAPSFCIGSIRWIKKNGMWDTGKIADAPSGSASVQAHGPVRTDAIAAVCEFT